MFDLELTSDDIDAWESYEHTDEHDDIEYHALSKLGHPKVARPVFVTVRFPEASGPYSPVKQRRIKSSTLGSSLEPTMFGPEGGTAYLSSTELFYEAVRAFALMVKNKNKRMKKLKKAMKKQIKVTRKDKRRTQYMAFMRRRKVAFWEEEKRNREEDYADERAEAKKKLHPEEFQFIYYWQTSLQCFTVSLSYSVFHFTLYVSLAGRVSFTIRISLVEHASQGGASIRFPVCF